MELYPFSLSGCTGNLFAFMYSSACDSETSMMGKNFMMFPFFSNTRKGLRYSFCELINPDTHTSNSGFTFSSGSTLFTLQHRSGSFSQVLSSRVNLFLEHAQRIAVLILRTHQSRYPHFKFGLHLFKRLHFI